MFDALKPSIAGVYNEAMKHSRGIILTEEEWQVIIPEAYTISSITSQYVRVYAAPRLLCDNATRAYMNICCECVDK